MYICERNFFFILNYIDKEILNEIILLKDFSLYFYRKVYVIVFIKDLRINDFIIKIILKYL